ncbi:hypothetical protein Ancab_040558 [Ancistrocladus abbreviatus]
MMPVCTCEATQSLQKKEQDQELLQFLMGLNDDYNMMRENIFMMNPLPSIGQAYSLLVQEEKQREIKSSSHFLIDSASLNVNVNAYRGNTMNKEKNGSRKSSWICTFCKKPGHLVEKCFKLHGYPPKNGKGKRMAAAVQGEFSVEGATGEVEGSLIPGFTVEQCNHLLSFLSTMQHQTTDSKSNTSCSNLIGRITCSSYSKQVQCVCFSCKAHNCQIWVIDTGASDHMCYDETCFFETTTLETPHKIALPNDQNVSVTRVGTIRLSPSLVLQEVLYVPSFKYNCPLRNSVISCTAVLFSLTQFVIYRALH